MELQHLGTLACDLYVAKLTESLPALATPPPWRPHSPPPSSTPEWLASNLSSSPNTSAQVRALIAVLSKYRGRQGDFHAMVFVRLRVHAVLLKDVLERAPEIEGWIRPDFLAGHGGSLGRREGAEGEEEVDLDFNIGMNPKQVRSFCLLFLL